MSSPFVQHNLVCSPKIQPGAFQLEPPPAPGAHQRILQLTFVLRPLNPAADQLTASQLS